VKQEIIADLSRITEEEQAILDGKTEVEKENKQCTFSSHFLINIPFLRIKTASAALPSET